MSKRSWVGLIALVAGLASFIVSMLFPAAEVDKAVVRDQTLNNAALIFFLVWFIDSILVKIFMVLGRFSKLCSFFAILLFATFGTLTWIHSTVNDPGSYEHQWVALLGGLTVFTWFVVDLIDVYYSLYLSKTKFVKILKKLLA